MINEVVINSKEHYQQIIEATNNELKSIPLFVKDLNGEIHIIPADQSKITVDKGFKLMYLGKKLDL